MLRADVVPRMWTPFLIGETPLSADDRRSSGLLITTRLGLYRKQHQPDAGCDFGNGHWHPAVLERRRMFGKDQTAKTGDRHDDRGKHAERRQDPGDIPRFEKQVKEEDGADTEEYRADVVRGETRIARQTH
jgi:hypothetical protein